MTFPSEAWSSAISITPLLVRNDIFGPKSMEQASYDKSNSTSKEHYKER